MPRVTSQKTRQSLLVVGDAIDTSTEPERLELFDIYGNPVTPGGISAANGVPVGGLTDQVLAKSSDLDFETQWVDPPEGGGGGTIDPGSIVESVYTDMILADGPKAYWPLVEDFVDLTGNGFDLDPFGGVTPGSGSEGPFGTLSTYFDGAGDRLNTPDAAILALAAVSNPDTITLEMWIKHPPTPTSGAAQIAGAGWTNYAIDMSGSGSNGIIFGVNSVVDAIEDGRYLCALHESIAFNEWTDPAQGKVGVNRWTHIALMFGGGSGRLQYNHGFIRAYGGSFSATGMAQFFVGGYGSSGAPRYFNGEIAHVAVYDRPLTYRELLRHTMWRPDLTVTIGEGAPAGPQVIMDEPFDAINPEWLDSNSGSDISTLTVVGGQLTTGSSAVDHDFHREDILVGDAKHHLKFFSNSAGALATIYTKWISQNEWLGVQIHKQDTAARIYYCDGGTPQQIGSLAFPSSDPMWLVAVMEGDLISAFLYNMDPKNHPVPYSQVGVNLRTQVSTSIGNKFGAGVEAFPGMRFTHFTTSYVAGTAKVDDWIILGPETSRYDF
jgi:hypothetical protein